MLSTHSSRGSHRAPAPTRRPSRLNRLHVIGLVATLAVTGLGVTSAQATGLPKVATVKATKAHTMFGSAVPKNKAAASTAGTQLGLKFHTKFSGTISGVRFYKARTNIGKHIGYLWTAKGHRLASVTFTKETTSGWQTARFSKPLKIKAGRNYVVSYYAPVGHFSADRSFFSDRSVRAAKQKAAANGLAAKSSVYRPGSSAFPTASRESSNYYVDVVFKRHKRHPKKSTTPVPTTTPTPTTPTPPAAPSAGGWPGASNTGVPAGTKLTPSGTITANTPGQVIDGKDISGCIMVTAPNVVVKNTRIRTTQSCGGEGSAVWTGFDNASVTLQDVEIDGLGHSWGNGVCCTGLTLKRVNIHDIGQAGVHFTDNLDMRDSWIHNLVYSNGDHTDTVLTNGAMSGAVISHNTLENPYTQTSVIALFEDFGRIDNVLVENNLLSGAGYSVYAGGDTSMGHSNIKFQNNHFTRKFYSTGGKWGPVTALDSSISWTGNVWDDTGAAVK